MSNSGQPAGSDVVYSGNFTSGTSTEAWPPSFPIMTDFVLPRDVPKNKNVAKKVKRAGWAKQFFER